MLLPQVSLGGTLLEFLPTILFIGWMYWLVSRQMRNMPGGFGGPGEAKADNWLDALDHITQDTMC